MVLPSVIFACGQFQVTHIDAKLVSALMVNLHTFRDRPVFELPCDAMRIGDSFAVATFTHLRITARRDIGRPKPTDSGFHAIAQKPEPHRGLF